MDREVKGPVTSYVRRHWRGELSLGVAFWINGALLNVIVGALAVVLVPRVAAHPSLLPAGFSWPTLLALLGAAVWTWEIVGIWRSADKSRDAGADILPTLAQVTTILRTAQNLVILIVVAMRPPGFDGEAVSPLEVRASADGSAVVVRGEFGAGAAARVRHILDSLPGAATLVLTSNGGRISEGLDIASAVRDRHLRTYVEDFCASACTEVLLAGTERAATPNARIGFHRPKYRGYGADSQAAAADRMAERYRRDGLPDAFVQHVVATPAETLWYPGTEALLAAHVLTRISLGGEYPTYNMAVGSKSDLREEFEEDSLWISYEWGFPGVIGRVTDSVWKVKRRGGTDGQISLVIAQFREAMDQQLIATLSDSLLDLYHHFVDLELVAARGIGAPACAAQWNGELRQTDVLPAWARDSMTQFKVRALVHINGSQHERPSDVEVAGIWRTVLDRLPKRLREVNAAPKAYADQPGLVCEMAFAMNASLAALPASERHLLLRSIYLSAR